MKLISTAIILAAGRGSRMEGLTANLPKCLLKLAGKPLLHWQAQSLKKAGIKRIIVVGGYQFDKLQGDFEKIVNPRWAQTNMVATLLHAFPLLKENEGTLIAYGDIIYRASHIGTLINSGEQIGITYDTLWEKLWRLRQGNPVLDAETFREENGRLLEIGNQPRDVEEIKGQYMGLIRLTPEGRKVISDYINEIPPEKVDKMDMTSLLGDLLLKGVRIGAIPVAGGWCECDTPGDVAHYERELAKGNWEHDWREIRQIPYPR